MALLDRLGLVASFAVSRGVAYSLAVVFTDARRVKTVAVHHNTI